MNFTTKLLTIAVPLLMASGGALTAAEFPVEGPITAVTVFPDRARVARSLEVRVPEGRHVVVVRGLPASLFPESLRVSGEGAIQIGAVELRPVHAEDLVRREEQRLRDQLEGLQDRRRALDNRTAALQTQLQFIASIGREMPKTANEEIIRGGLNPQSWQEAWKLIGSGAGETYEQIQAAEIEKRNVDRKMNKVKRQLSQVQTGRKATLEAHVQVAAESLATAKLALSYQLPGASWRPLYDARLNSSEDSMELVQIGEVRQRTGEDWQGVALTLSTARPGLGAVVPKLETWFIDFGRPPPELSRLKELQDQLQVQKQFAMTQEESDAAPVAAPPPSEPAAYQLANVEAGEFAAVFNVEGRVTLPADNAAHKFPLTQRDVPVALAVRSVPKINAVGYLLAKADYTGEDSLLPGPVSLFRDGEYVGTSALKLTRTGESFKLSFGIDDKVRLRYRLIKGERSQEGIINKEQRLERRYRIEVTNFHKKPVRITVLDQIPVAQDERIEVEWLRDTTKPTDKDVDKRPGVLAWTETYEPGEKREINFGYAVTVPEGLTVPGF